MVSMQYLDGVLGGIGIGAQHGILTPFVIEGKGYVAIARMKGAKNQVVCLALNESGEPHNLQLATFSPQVPAFAASPILPNGPQVVVEPDSAQLTCHMMALVALTELDEAHDHLPPNHDDEEVLVKLADTVVVTALTAGAFGNTESVARLMEFGKGPRARRGLRWVRDADRHAERLRAACKPGDREAIRAFAALLVYNEALFIIERRVNGTTG